ncbi:hypothetical protein PBY51_016500 [Eleginops maclovinus]|nr:hypothetical protein PBY51_016500 [Eleginops maclovinus]
MHPDSEETAHLIEEHDLEEDEGFFDIRDVPTVLDLEVIQVPASPTPGPSTTIAYLAPGRSTLAPGTSTLAPGRSTLAPGRSTLAPGTSTLAPGRATLASGTSNLAPDTSYLAPGSSSSTDDDMQAEEDVVGVSVINLEYVCM